MPILDRIGSVLFFSNKHIDLYQIRRIAHAGFPDHVKEVINIDNAGIHSMGDVYRLFERDAGYRFVLPSVTYLSIEYRHGWVSFDAGIKAFNQLAAMKEMKKLKLIKL